MLMKIAKNFSVSLLVQYAFFLFTPTFVPAQSQEGNPIPKIVLLRAGTANADPACSGPAVAIVANDTPLWGTPRKMSYSRKSEKKTKATSYPAMTWMSIACVSAGYPIEP